jgi:predicted phage terminase large subunit-like protein
VDKRAELARLLEEKRRRHAEASLAEYCRQAWKVIEPATPLLWNDHLDIICDDLEVASDAIDPTLPPPLDALRDVWNMPPRYMKSSIITVMWPTWEWGPRRLPFSRWLFGAFNSGLATFHSVARRLIIESDWYQQRWGHVFTLSSDQNVKTEFTNNHRGVMLSAGMHGSRLGRGGLRVVIDDPHDPEQALSDNVREADVRRFKQSFATRLDDKRRGFIGIVMQRLHEADLAAHAIGLGYRRVKFENPAQDDYTITSRKGRVFSRAAGELLWPEREDERGVAEMRRTLGPYGFAGQYLQEPSPVGGVIFQREWWKFYKQLPDTRSGKAISIDCAFKGNDDSDYVGSAVGVFAGATTHLVEIGKERLTYPGTKALVRTLRGRHPDASHIYVEDKANGPAIIDDMREQIAGLVPVDPQGGKISRAHSASGDVEAGNVKLPEYLTETGEVIPGREWVPEFIDRMAKFPRIANDDDIDAFTQLIIARRLSTAAILEYMRREHDKRVTDALSDAMSGITIKQDDVESTSLSVSDAMKVFGR